MFQTGVGGEGWGCAKEQGIQTDLGEVQVSGKGSSLCASSAHVPGLGMDL